MKMKVISLYIDTSYDINPLYQNRVQDNLLFGRGFKAGIDYRD